MGKLFIFMMKTLIQGVVALMVGIILWALKEL